MRICPECQSRELDEKCPRQRICSECRENNRYFSNLESDAKWRKNNPEKFKASRKISNRKYKLKMKQAG